jgi:hypothetical protein
MNEALMVYMQNRHLIFRKLYYFYLFKFLNVYGVKAMGNGKWEVRAHHLF